MSNLILLKTFHGLYGLSFMLLSVFMLSAITARAKSFKRKIVKGNVIFTGDVMSLLGVSIVHSENPTATDAIGNYQINLSSSKSTLSASCLGFKTQLIAVKANFSTIQFFDCTF